MAVSGLRYLNLSLTAACNLDCAYCAQRREHAQRPRVLARKHLYAALDLALQSTEHRVRVTFTGGEPLLEYDLLQRAVAYVGENKPPGKQFKFCLFTNGIGLSPERIAYLDNNRFDIQLSCDGVAAAQEFRGAGTFTRLDCLFTELRRRHEAFFKTRLSVAVTVHPGNLRWLADSIEYLLTKRVRSIKLSPVLDSFDGAGGDFREAFAAQFARIDRASRQHFERTGEVPVTLLKNDSETETRRVKTRPMCTALAGRSLAVDYRGVGFACSPMSSTMQRMPEGLLTYQLPGLVIGDVCAPDFQDRWQRHVTANRADLRADAVAGSDVGGAEGGCREQAGKNCRASIFRNKENKYSSFARCAECRWLDRCGVCPLSIGYLAGNTDPNRVPDFHCAFNLAAFTYQSQFPSRPAGALARMGAVGFLDTFTAYADAQADAAEDR